MHVSNDFEGQAPEGFETTPALDEPSVTVKDTDKAHKSAVSEKKNTRQACWAQRCGLFGVSFHAASQYHKLQHQELSMYIILFCTCMVTWNLWLHSVIAYFVFPTCFVVC